MKLFRVLGLFSGMKELVKHFEKDVSRSEKREG